MFLTLLAVSALPAQSVYPYRAVDLGTPPNGSPSGGVGAASISADGRTIAGTQVWEPYVWTEGLGMRSLTKLSGKLNADVLDVDLQGNAVGSCGWQATTNQQTAVRWDANGTPQTLGSLGGPFSIAIAINSSGTIVGNASVTRGPSYDWHAFLWTKSSGLIDLTPAATNAWVYDLNDAGQILLDIDGVSYRMSPGIGLQNFGNVSLLRINESGQMTGKDPNGVSGRYTDGIGWEWFGGGSNGIEFRDHGNIDVFGRIVGTQWIRVSTSPPTYQHRGYLYTFGLGFERLDEQLDPNQLVRVEDMAGITERGFIACNGSFGSNNRAMRLEPRFTSYSGTACSGSRGEPKVAFGGVPARGRRVALLGAGAAASGMFLVAAKPAAIALPGGCTLLVDPLGMLAIPVPVNPIGQASAIVVVPPDLPKLPLYLQFVSADPQAPNGYFALSDSVRVDLQ